MSFKDVFPEEERQEISSLIKDIPSNQSLEIIAHISARYHANENNNQIHGEILRQWLGRLDDKIKDDFLKAALPHIKRNNFLFINQPSCLYLIQEIILNYNVLENRELTPDDELNLFKAYLIASEWSIKVSSTIQESGIKDLPNFVGLALKTQLPISDLKHSREFYIQAYKAISYFQFSDSHEDFKDIIAEFVKSTSLNDWNEYLKSILLIYSAHLLKFDEPNRSVLEFSEPNHIVNFLNILSLDPSNFEAKPDFISIREKPVIKIRYNIFLFLNLDLFIDKIFSGILFDIFTSLSKKKYGNISTSDFGTFKSSIGELFTEQILFYEVMNYIKQDTWVAFSGNELRKKIDGEPDYYIRRRSKVFLFECKDTLIRSDTKNSFDFETIQNEITEKLILGNDEKNKGISQILYFISRLEEGLLDDIDDFDPEKCKFYPIIIVTDKALNEHGVNYIFNSSFDELIKKFGLQDYRIQLPVLIHLDDLIKFADLFKDEDLKLNSIFDDYIAFGNSKDYFVQSSSFSNFLMKKAFKYMEKPTSLIDSKLKEALE